MSDILGNIEATEEVDRKGLATIQRVLSLDPIPGKDKIEFATVQGWIAVVEKGLHKVDDLVLVVRYDSILPQIDMFEWMRDSKFRVKSKSFTIRDENNEIIDKVYSQVIVIRLDKVKEYFKENNIGAICEEGSDLTDDLKIIKYIPKETGATKCQFGTMKRASTFPSNIISKTDETNCISENTLLETEDGFKTIKEICDSKYKGKIKSYNEEKGIIEFNHVINHFIKKNNNDWYEVELENGEKIITTSIHSFFLPNLGCYRELRYVNENDIILFSN